MKQPPFPYRLGLKLFASERAGQLGGSSSIGWSVIRMNQTQPECQTGADEAALARTLAEESPPWQSASGSVCRVLIYERPEDMLEPMSANVFEARLQQVINNLPAGVVIERVLFEAGGYRAWLGGRDDTHESRAEWALAQG